MSLKRIRSGIKGLDMTLGGLPLGRTVLVTGDAGSGKTIFGLQFALECCAQGLTMAYITTEETVPDLKLQAGSFNWDFERFEKKGLVKFIEMTGKRLSEIESSISIQSTLKGDFRAIMETVPEDTKVLIIDSLGSHSANLEPREFKDRLDLLIYNLKEKEITTLIILDSATSKDYNDLALFSVFGAIQLLKRENPYTGMRERIMDIVKMRTTKTPLQPLIYEIGKDGIVISFSDKMP